MVEPRRPLALAEHRAITEALLQYKARLEESGDLLAAMHIEHALQCLDPENPLNQPAPSRA